MEKKEKQIEKSIYKKWWFWVIIFWILTIGFGVSDELNNTTNTKNEIENQTSQVSNNNNEVLQQDSNNSNNEAQQQDSKNSDNNKNNVSTKSRVSQLKLETLDVYNGFETEVIGKCHVIKADKKTIFDFSADEWLEFKATFIDTHKEDKWLTIYFEDKTGIIFTGMDYIGTLCNINAEEQFCAANPSKDLEYIEIFTESNKVNYDFPENGKSKNYFTGLEK